ncbi:hypothetical protein [Acinetobacter guillouiae]|uniref:hypothetical protein n=1 Tax=Acinetobacter guillouiae TaxID=106649 RepID=UPI003C704246
MDKEKLHELRAKITISISDACTLLKQYDVIEHCIQVYHQQNIEKICAATDCKGDLAREYYDDPRYHHNLEKIIQKINEFNQRIIKLSIDENPKYVDKVGFFIWAEDENLERIQNKGNRTYFIPQDDFAYVIKIFRSFSPLRNEFECSFDPCSDNYFDQNAIQDIILKIKDLHFNESKVMSFLEKLVCCLEEKIKIGTYVVIFGNQ